MSTVHTHHAIDYVEITVTDIDAAKAFYAAAFGWSLVDYGPDYAGIQGDGKEMGGLRRDSEVRARGPLVILTPRISSAARRRSRSPAAGSSSPSTRSRAAAASTSPTRPGTSSPSGPSGPREGPSNRLTPRAVPTHRMVGE